MCGGIQYQDHKIYFPQPDARLPVLLRHGNVTWIIWGKRKTEGSGKFPNSGWARIDSIKMGKWKPWHPRPVLIPAESFMETITRNNPIGSLWHLGWRYRRYWLNGMVSKECMWLLKRRHLNITGFMIGGRD